MMASEALGQHQQSGQQATHKTLLAVLPLGTGSDYSKMMGW
jgi:diacylglycerol kinase family enzyme